jgi:hypothetical protein
MIKELKKSQLKNLLKEKNLLEFNRDIQPRHVDKMMKSVMDCGILRLPVIGDVSSFDNTGRDLVIVDGQHLCQAIVNLPVGSLINNINVIVKKYNSKKEVIEDISKLNNTQKSWNDANYLDAWVKYGRDNDNFSNYSYLHNLYVNVFDGLAIGFLVDTYAVTKLGFREGTLSFKNRELSDKIASFAYDLNQEFNTASFALTGLRMWVFDRVRDNKTIDWTKLKSRVTRAIRKGEDKNCQGREDFRQFVQDNYTRI